MSSFTMVKDNPQSWEVSICRYSAMWNSKGKRDSHGRPQLSLRDRYSSRGTLEVGSAAKDLKF